MSVQCPSDQGSRAAQSGPRLISWLAVIGEGIPLRGRISVSLR